MIATLAEPNYAEPKTVRTPKIPPVTYAIYRLPKAQATRGVWEPIKRTPGHPAGLRVGRT